MEVKFVLSGIIVPAAPRRPSRAWPAPTRTTRPRPPVPSVQLATIVLKARRIIFCTDVRRGTFVRTARRPRLKIPVPPGRSIPTPILPRRTLASTPRADGTSKDMLKRNRRINVLVGIFVPVPSVRPHLWTVRSADGVSKARIVHPGQRARLRVNRVRIVPRPIPKLPVLVMPGTIVSKVRICRPRRGKRIPKG